MMNSIQKNKGFTLIELMIVVAIIGILAAIAIPNFLQFQAKSKQAEVKSNLGSMHTALDTFRSEYGSYTTDLTVIGWAPSGSPRYNYGFKTDNHDPSGNLAGFASANNNSADKTLDASLLGQMIKSDGSPLLEGDLPDSIAVQTYYTMGAVGNLDNDTTNDEWIINANRALTNLTNDVGN